MMKKLRFDMRFNIREELSMTAILKAIVCEVAL